MYKTIGLLAAICCFNSLNAQIAYEPGRRLSLDERVITGTFENGMHYYILENRKPDKRMEIRLSVNAGSILEDDDQQGLAHFLEHMAFNGSEHFQGNTMISFLEKTGVKFGPHLNAYTSFDETVYMLQIPTDRSSLIDSGLMVFRDWAAGISFDAAEVDKERGVVIEEWRLRLGADERMRQKYWPAIFQGTQYADRLPIGKVEVLEKFDRQRVVDFYRKWYRPDLMSLMVVGDFDAREMEKKMKEKFGSIMASGNPAERKDFNVADFEGLRIGIASDKEAEYSQVQIYYMHDSRPFLTQKDYLDELARDIFSAIITERLDEYSVSENPIASYIGGYYSPFVRTKDAFASYAYTDDQNIIPSLKALILENKRAIDHGVSQSEVDRQKKAFLNELERAFLEMDKTESDRQIQQYVDHSLKQRAYLNPSYELELFRMLSDSITVERINRVAKEMITTGKNTVIIVTGPEKDNARFPTEDEIRKLYMSGIRQKTKPYKDVVIAEKLLVSEPLPGRIRKETYYDKVDATLFECENGARILLKTTDFKNDEILALGMSAGGGSLLSDADYHKMNAAVSIADYSGLESFDYNALGKFLTDKTLSGGLYVSDYWEHINGQSSVKDFEVMMQYLYAQMINPKFTDKGLKTYLQEEMSFLKEKNDPLTIYYDSLTYILYNRHERARPMDIAMAKSVTLKDAEQIFRGRFSSAGDFDFCIVGNIDAAALRPFIEKYIASQPAVTQRETHKGTGKLRSREAFQHTILKGKEQKAMVNIIVTGDYFNNDYRQTNSDMKVISKVLNTRLREVLREDMGGVYGIQASGFCQRIDDRCTFLGIGFGCDPKRADELIDAAKKVLADLKANGPSEDDMIKMRETARRERETNQKENRWWLNALLMKLAYNDDISDVITDGNEVYSVSREEVKAIFNRHFDASQMKVFRLMPEK